jgi:hypothetical protein
MIDSFRLINNTKKGYEDEGLYQEMSFSSFMSHLASNDKDKDKEVLYLRQVPLFEELKSDLKELHVCLTLSLHTNEHLQEDDLELFLWIGQKGSKTPLHFDPKHNLHTVIRYRSKSFLFLCSMYFIDTML